MIGKTGSVIAGFLLGVSVVTLADSSAKGCQDFGKQCLSALIAEAQARAWVGMALQHCDSQVGHLAVSRVAQDSPASEAGILKGDLIVGIGDASFKALNRFDAIDALAQKTFAELAPGKAVTVHLERGPAELTVQLTPAVHNRDSLAEFIGRRLMGQFPELVAGF